MQARGQIKLLATVAAVMSMVRWLKNKRAHHFSQWEVHLPLLLTSRKGRCYTARREEPTITMMMKFKLKLPSAKFKFAKMSILLETLIILVANISRFTTVASFFSTTLVIVHLESITPRKTTACLIV